jgi:hypothetical protein
MGDPMAHHRSPRLPPSRSNKDALTRKCLRSGRGAAAGTAAGRLAVTSREGASRRRLLPSKDSRRGKLATADSW